MPRRKRPNLDPVTDVVADDRITGVVAENSFTDEVPGDPDTGPTCVYRAGKSRIVKGLDVQAAYQNGWYDVPTDHPDSRENPKR